MFHLLSSSLLLFSFTEIHQLHSFLVHKYGTVESVDKGSRGSSRSNGGRGSGEGMVLDPPAPTQQAMMRLLEGSFHFLSYL